MGRMMGFAMDERNRAGVSNMGVARLDQTRC